MPPAAHQVPAEQLAQVEADPEHTVADPAAPEWYPAEHVHAMHEQSERVVPAAQVPVQSADASGNHRATRMNDHKQIPARENNSRGTVLPVFRFCASERTTHMSALRARPQSNDSNQGTTRASSNADEFTNTSPSCHRRLAVCHIRLEPMHHSHAERRCGKGGGHNNTRAGHPWGHPPQRSADSAAATCTRTLCCAAPHTAGGGGVRRLPGRSRGSVRSSCVNPGSCALDRCATCDFNNGKI